MKCRLPNQHNYCYDNGYHEQCGKYIDKPPIKSCAPSAKVDPRFGKRLMQPLAECFGRLCYPLILDNLRSDTFTVAILRRFVIALQRR